MQLINRAIEILDHLVAFDTARLKLTKPLVSRITRYLAQLYARATCQVDATGFRQTLIATINDGANPDIRLSGLANVVPPIPELWASHPFRLRVANDRHFGRDTSDRNGFVSIVLAAAVPRT